MKKYFTILSAEKNKKMKLDSTYNFFRLLKEDNLAFIYQGSFSNKIIAMATNLIKNNIDNKSGFVTLRNKLSFLMVESFQNIVRHGDKSDLGLGQEIFITRNFGNTYYIISANLIENEKVDFLKEKLEQVNTADKDDLKKLYVEVLTNKKLSSKGGAGLGLIDMARKSGEKLIFDFVPINKGFSFFYLQMRLKSKNKKVIKERELPLEQSKELHVETSKSNLFIIQKGNFSQDAIGPVLKMVENNMQNQVLRVQKIAFLMLVEILQNISKHAFPIDGIKEGIFLMGEYEDKYIISTGNYIENRNIPYLKDYLASLNKLSKEELNTLYRKTLREGREIETETGGAGLGLIDIARESCDKLEYEFFPIDDKLSFFSIIVKIKSR